MTRIVRTRALIGIAAVVTLGCDRSPAPSPGGTSVSASTNASSAASVAPKNAISGAPSSSSIASVPKTPSASNSAAPSASAANPAKVQISLEGPIGEACKAWASARCAAIDRCAHPFLVIDSGDVARCERSKAIECVAVAIAEGSGATAASITACAKETEAVACDALDHLPPKGACALSKGSRPDDASCIDDEQCASGFCGRAPISSTCGKCKPAPTTGAPCGKTYCALGQSCVSSKCEPRAELGGACSGTGASGSCQPWLSCVSGKCASPANAVGAACSILGDAPDCDWRLGLYCDLSSTCKAATIAREGESCASEDGAMHVCAGDLVCRRADQKSGSRCVPRPRPGEPCDEPSGLYCSPPYRCLAGKCALATIADCK